MSATDAMRCLEVSRYYVNKFASSGELVDMAPEAHRRAFTRASVQKLKNRLLRDHP